MAEEQCSKNTTIIDQKQEVMIHHTTCQFNQNPLTKTANFLKPTLNPDFLPPKPPKIQPFSPPPKVPFSFHCKTRFHCKSHPLEGYKSWVKNLEKTHEKLWRKVGIFDAIKGSTYQIAKNYDLIFKLVEKWCPETNTFVFPWGEVTITLEDIFVLGGFSPLGISVLDKTSVFLGENVKKVECIENELIMCYEKVSKIDRFVHHFRWQEHVMGCGGETECAGFLALWLARHVFPPRAGLMVQQSVFSVAAGLCCGVKYAFGPAVLASIYRDLTLLKRRNVVGNLTFLSPIHLVQAWALERFLLLGPVPRMIGRGETRLSRWETRTRSRRRRTSNDIDVETVLDTSREVFRWRPYGMSLENWSMPRFYVDFGTWVVVDSDEEWKLFAKCLMACQLKGLNCVQEYNPHRVALQFGYDQDIPLSIDRSKASGDLSIEGLKLYLPPRLHEGDVTFRYSKWWGTQFNLVEEALVGCKRKKRSMKRVKKMSKICEIPKDKSLPSKRLPSRNPLQVDDVPTCVSTMDTGANSREKTSNSSEDAVNVAEPLTEHWIGTATPIEHEVDLESAGMKQGCVVTDPPCSSVPCREVMNSDCARRHLNIASEVREVMVTSPLKTPEEGLGISLHETPEQNEPDEALCHDKNNIHGNVADDSQMLSSDEECGRELNPLAALCDKYESRISNMETELSALIAAYGTSISE